MVNVVFNDVDVHNFALLCIALCITLTISARIMFFNPLNVFAFKKKTKPRERIMEQTNCDI